MLHYGIITALSRELLLNSQDLNTESSKHCHVDSSWMNGSCWNMK